MDGAHISVGAENGQPAEASAIGRPWRQGETLA
jgi:hypothetical protein